MPYHSRTSSAVGEDAVRAVMAGCGCSETRAKSLLRVHPDPSEAIKFHRDTSSSISERPPLRQRSRSRRNSYVRPIEYPPSAHAAHTEEIQSRSRYPPNSMHTGPGRYFSESGCVVPSSQGGARSEIMGGTTRVPEEQRKRAEVWHAGGYYTSEEEGMSPPPVKGRTGGYSQVSQDSGVSVGRRPSRRDKPNLGGIYIPKPEATKHDIKSWNQFREPVGEQIVPSPHALRAGLSSFRPPRNDSSERDSRNASPRPAKITIPQQSQRDTPHYLRTPTSDYSSDDGFEHLTHSPQQQKSPIIVPLKIHKPSVPPPKVPPPEIPSWDFTLPSFSAPVDGLSPPTRAGASLSLRALVGSLQAGASFEQVKAYLASFPPTTVRTALAGTLSDFALIFYAAATNSPDILRLFVEYGADVNATAKEPPIPLLAFVVCYREGKWMDTTALVATLLSLGAEASTIPRAFYSNSTEDLPADGPSDADLSSDLHTAACAWARNSAMRTLLARNLNLTQRYYLQKSVQVKKPYIRHKQVAARFDASALLGIHYFLIGQTLAAEALKRKLLANMLVGEGRPLVLVFAGPSGHGKTELARRLGHLLSLPMQLTDCTIFSKETDLFGPRAPYTGSDRGSPLNNFLAANSGKRSIVFLDEFEKTTKEIHKSLLIPFDRGEYQDRRTLGTVDCSKTIWILATNQLDPTIKTFCARNPQILSESEAADGEFAQKALMKKLERELKEGFKAYFDPPLTGRVSSFLPFLPFTQSERAVVAHKYVMELSNTVSRPVNLSVENPQLVGNITLNIRKDASLCRQLAEGYDEDLGARSLITAVKGLEEAVIEAYLDVEAAIEEGKGGTELNVCVGDEGVEVVPV